MVGSAVGGGGGGGGDRSRDAVGMMALHEALKAICLDSDWTYSVFWTIRPRPRVRGGNGCKVGDDNGSLMLMWEDGFCRGRVGDCLEGIEGEDPVRKAFSKMSIQLYNYGEGLMGKVASDKCHKWVFKEPNEIEPNISNYWQSSFDAIPPEWTDQFESGIQTIAVIQAGHGLLQLGSHKIIPEDLHFVLRMRHSFQSLGYQSGFYLTQLFSSNRTSSPSSSIPAKPFILPNQQQQPLPPLFNWTARPTSMLPSSSFQNPSAARFGGFPQGGNNKDETDLFLQFAESHDSNDTNNMMGEHDDNDIKWSYGLSFFNALVTGRADEANDLLFNSESSFLDQPDRHQDSINLEGKDFDLNPNEFLSLDSHPKLDNKLKRSYNLLAESHDSNGTNNMMGEHDDNDVKWSYGLSFFNALVAGRADEANDLLFNSESRDQPDHHQNPMNLEGKDFDLNPNEFLSLDSRPKLDNKLKRSYHLPARMDSSASSTSLNQYQHRQHHSRS